MIKQDQAQQLLDGGSVVGIDGDSIGKIGQVYLDNDSGNVSWVTVKTGFFGASEAFVPTDQATVSGDTVTAPYDKAKVKGAPHFEVGTELSPSDEEELYRYYGIGSGLSAQDVSSEYVAQTPAKTATAPENTVRTEGTDRTDTAAARTSGDGSITRSEEQLHVGYRTRRGGPGPAAQVRRDRAADGHRAGQPTKRLTSSARPSSRAIRSMGPPSARTPSRSP